MILISLILQACNMPGAASTPNTELDPVLAAQMTITAAGLNQPLAATATYTAIPELSPTPTFTTIPALTSTPDFAYVTLSEATNCRTGADVAFELVDTFQVGQTIQVLGKHSFDNYWYVRSPNNPSINCWMWGAYATGANLGNVPIVTPPPSPTPAPTSTLSPIVISTIVIDNATKPAFFPSYVNSGKCLAWWTRIKIQNVGSVTIKSISISIKDTVTNETRNSSTNGFQDLSGCALAPIKSTLASTESATVVAPSLNADPAGHKISVTVTGCTEINSGGACSSAAFEFTP
jgi:hypothetical protein